jgi:hypothetical protein
VGDRFYRLVERQCEIEKRVAKLEANAPQPSYPCPYCTWMGNQPWFAGNELAKSLFLNHHDLETCPHRIRMRSYEAKL